MKLTSALIQSLICLTLVSQQTSQASEAALLLDHARHAGRSPASACATEPRLDWQGHVSSSPLLKDIGGFAAEATGGLGKPLLKVESDDDSKSSPSRPARPGTLRWALDTAAAQGGGWIVFTPFYQPRIIEIDSTLRVPSNVTLDGSCGGVTLRGEPRLSLLTLKGVDNVVISGLSFTKSPYAEGIDKTGDAISLTGWVDRIAIINNAFSRCGDGCLDIVRLERDSRQGRITVARNRFEHHNKTMLIGTLACYQNKDLDGCDSAAPYNEVGAPTTYVSITRNVFDGVSQRNPKVVSNSLVQFAGNLIVLKPTPYETGRGSATYGSIAASGGILVTGANVYVNEDVQQRRVATGSISLISRAEGEGFVLGGRDFTFGHLEAVKTQTPAGIEVSVPPVALAQHPKDIAACAYAGSGPQGLARAKPSYCP